MCVCSLSDLPSAFTEYLSRIGYIGRNSPVGSNYALDAETSESRLDEVCRGTTLLDLNTGASSELFIQLHLPSVQLTVSVVFVCIG